MSPAKAFAGREALRQQALLSALLDSDVTPLASAGWLRDGPRQQRGLAAYRAHAHALAERALGAAFPTLRQLIGAEDFKALACDFWHRRPPQAGDIALWGDELPAFIADAPSLAAEPFLADVAHLEWAVHQAGRAADAVATPQGVELLGSHDPSLLALRLAPGAAVLLSAHPVASLWLAHRRDDADRFDSVRAAFASGHGETALVLREGWRVGVCALADGDARFIVTLLAGCTLAQALDAAGAGFDFTVWLVDWLRRQRALSVVDLAAEAAT